MESIAVYQRRFYNLNYEITFQFFEKVSLRASLNIY